MSAAADDNKRPTTPFGTITLEQITSRFADGTDVEKVKPKKRRANAYRQRQTKTNNKKLINAEHAAAAPRYFLFEGRISSGFLHFRAFLFNDILLLATPGKVQTVKCSS
jgi:hypothetical protein